MPSISRRPRRSPALPFLVYDLETAFEIVVTHEKRHLNQVDETLEALGIGAPDA